MAADRSKARENERRYRAANLDAVRARQAEHKRKSRAKDPDAAKAIARRHYAKHRDKIRSRERQRYADTQTGEIAREYSRNYRAAHKESVNAAIRQWRKDNPEKAKAVGQAWYKANPAAVKACRRRRRALLDGATVNDLTAAQWTTIQAAFDHCCAYCGKRCKGKLTQDHITPLSKGGGHTASNIVPACGPCNSTKHTGPPLAPVQPLLIA